MDAPPDTFSAKIVRTEPFAPVQGDMPTYEYKCQACGHHFEKVQKITDDSVVECPKCAADARRLISGGAGLLFKGSGFYTTDYRSDTYKKAEKKETAASGSSDEAGSSSSATSGKKKESKKDSK